MKPEFSIIIPAKNEIANFRRTLPVYKKLKESFSCEIIAALGHSDDGSVDYARIMTDQVVVQTKKGRETIGEGRNRGAVVANGDIFVFLDAGVVVPEINHFFDVIRE